MSSTTFKLFAVASLAIVLTSCLLAHAKPFRRGAREMRPKRLPLSQRDPLLAVANEAPDAAIYEPDSPLEPRRQRYHFQNQQVHEQPQMIREIIHYEPVEHLAQPQAHQHDPIDCHHHDHHDHHNQREQLEYVSIIDSPTDASSTNSQQEHEYPGELVYIGQNSEAQEQQSVSGEQLSKLGATISHHPGMPATILTEVPVGHMPSHVLEKLRKDYGVKVVATREHPGANLIINCDEHFGQGASICARQLAPTQPAFSAENPIAPPPPYTFVSGQSNQSEQLRQGELPKTFGENSNLANEMPSAAYKADDIEHLRSRVYMDRNGEAQAVDKLAKEEEAYGMRNLQLPAVSSGQPSEYTEGVPQNDLPAEPKTEAQAEPTYEGSQASNGPPHEGFDSEPSNNQEQTSPSEATK